MIPYLEAFWSVLLELAPWLLLGAGLAGVLHVVVPRDLIERHLTGYGGVVRAVLAGVPLPLCSCGVIPAGIGLKRDGASDGSSVAFLVATPQTGVDAILVSASFLGWPFALFKVAAAGVTGVLAGSLVEAAGGPPRPVDDSASAASDHDDPRPAWQQGLAHAEDVIRSIWRWLVFGVAVSALLTVALPTGALADTALAAGALAALVSLAVSVPLYVCATASVPIAAGLLHAGLPPSAALVFLMAGPATNVATVGAIHRTFGLRVLSIYLGTVILGSLGLGLAFDSVLPVTTTLGGAHEHGSWIATGSAALLLGLFAWYALDDLRSVLRARREARGPAPAQSLKVEVEGMTCQGCARRLDTSVRAVDGIDAVTISVDAGLLEVSSQSGLIDDAKVRQAIVDAGFTPAS